MRNKPPVDLDSTTIQQAIDYYVMDGVLNQASNQAILAQLREAGIVKTPSGRPLTDAYLAVWKNRLLKKPGIPPLPTVFYGGVGPRHGKDKSYEALWRTVELTLPNQTRVYMGLAAHNLSQVLKYSNLGIIFEKDFYTCSWLERALQRFDPEAKSRLSLINQDILSLSDEELVELPKVNILDLDLMCCLFSYREGQIGRLITSVVEAPAVVSITTCIGREISRAQYSISEILKIIEESPDLRVKHQFSGSYRDRIIPIQYEHLVLERKERKEKENV